MSPAQICRHLRTHIYIVAFGALLATAVTAQAPTRELLNSERIAQRFGNYGIEVLDGGDTVRVSNLFSTEHGAKTCRTFAVVVFPSSVAPELAAEHAKIMNGGSIGAVFAAQGWQVSKTHLFYGELAAPPRLARLMRVVEGTPLTEHAYVLDVAKDGKTFEYAALVEIHHPSYLTRADVLRVYGPASPSGRETLVATLIATAAERAAR